MIETKFKHTDIGLVPEEWEVSSFGAEFKKLNAASYTWSETIREGNCVYLHYGDIHTKYHDHLDVSKDELPYISDAKAKRFTKLQDGDLIMLNASEDYDGVSDCVEITNCNKQLIAGQHTIPLRPVTGKLANGFIGYITSIPSVRMQLVENAVGTKVYGVTNEMLQTVLLPIPPKQEQQRIASALMNIDALIFNLDKLIAKKQAIKKGAMQELLTGKKRLPGFKGEWKVKTLIKVARLKSGKNIDLIVEKQGIYPCFGGNGIRTYISRYSHEGTFPIIGRQGELCGNVQLAMGKFYATEHAVVCRPYSDIDAIWLYYQLVMTNLNQYKTGNAQPGLSVKKIEQEVTLQVPHIDEQRAIAHVLSTMDSDISMLEQKRNKYRQIKQGMMRDLLTGRIRLTD